MPGFWARPHGNRYELKYRVGAFSHGEALFPTRPVARATSPWLFKRRQADMRYSFRGRPSSVTDYYVAQSRHRPVDCQR
jgi:hypothetical protein